MLPRLLPAGRLLLGLLLAAFEARAQPEPVKFGLVDGRELTAAPFVADSAAAAVVLCDFGRSRLRGQGAGFQVVFERVTRLKILRKAGYEYATVEIPLYRRDEQQEKISNLRGWTYNLVDGHVVKTKLEPSGAFQERRTPSLTIQKFTLPDVREGAVVEYAYTLTSDFLFNFQDWQFQRAIPVRWSEYRTSIPVFYRYKIIYQGGRPFDVDQATAGSANLVVDEKVPGGAGLSSGTTVGTLTIGAPTEEHQWALKNVPALAEEPYMTTAGDYVARLDFELTGEQWPDQPYRDLTGTWRNINAQLLAHAEFGAHLGHTGFWKEEMRALAAQYPIVAARAAAVRAAVLAAVRHNGTDAMWTPTALRRTYDAHRGTAADVNLLLLAALREAGLEAHPLLLSTRSHGRVSQEYPLLERFNYVVALLTLPDGTDLLLDATEPLLPCGMLPERCLNGAGRLIVKNETDGRWVSLAPAQRRVHYQQVALTLDAQGGLQGTVHEEYGGYAGRDARAGLAALGEKKYLAALLGRHEGWAVPQMEVAGREDVARPLALNYAFSQPAAAAAAGPATLHLSPLAGFGPGQNPFQRESRAFPVDFGVGQEATIVLSLALPAGYEVTELPKPAVVDLPDNGGRYTYSVAAPAPGTVQLTSRLSLRKPVYAAEEYASLREFYRIVLEKQAERLVIRKKTD